MKPLSLFAGIGIELEYMIVNAETLSVFPVADEVLRAAAGSYESSVDREDIAWSNELALHVIELKTNGPATKLAGLPERIQVEVQEINRLLQPLGGCLLPTGMHPWMDPRRETRLWPHEYNPIYETFNRIFSCQGHGWSNLQSIHLNLPFADDAEFARLHAAIRLVLPILPALAASSPFQDGRFTDYLDNRLNVYRTNSAKIPSITGRVIPEPVFTQHDYETQILQRIYRDIAPFDPEGVLQNEWLNARGAIARFERNTIEIRVLDVQECPQADLAIAAAIIAVLRALVNERWTDLESQKSLSTESLESIFLASIRLAEGALVAEPHYLRVFGCHPDQPCTAGELWARLLAGLMPAQAEEVEPFRNALSIILNQGCLARRILRATGKAPSHERLKAVYGQLSRCLADGNLFCP